MGLIARLLVVYAFLVAALPKIENPTDFAVGIMGYQMVPWGVATLVAAFLPWLELSSALALLFRPWRVAAVAILICLLVAFTALHAFTWAQGLTVDCGCFGAPVDGSSTHPMVSISINIGLLVLIGVSQYIGLTRRSMGLSNGDSADKSAHSGC